MRPEHSETKNETEIGEGETETETENRNKLVKSVACESKRTRYAFIVDYILQETNNE